MRITYRTFIFLALLTVSLSLFGQDNRTTGFQSWQIDLFARFQNVEPKFTLLDQVDSFPARTSIISQIGLAREYTIVTTAGDTLLFLSNAKDEIAAAPDIKFVELTTTLHRRFVSGFSLFAGVTYARYSSVSKQRISPSQLEGLGDAYEAVVNKEEYLGLICGADYYVNRTKKWQPFIGLAADWYIRRIVNEATILGIPARDYYEENDITLERQLRSTLFDGSAMIRLGFLYKITPKWSTTLMWRSDQLSRRHKGLLPGVSLRYGWSN